MRARTVLAAVLIPVAGVGLAGSALASGGSTTVHLRAVHGDSPATSGRAFIDTDALFNPAGSQVGDDVINCVPARNFSSRCSFAIALAHGNLLGTFTETSSGGISGKITGGTRGYHGVKGTIRGKDAGQSAQLTLTYHH